MSTPLLEQAETAIATRQVDPFIEAVERLAMNKDVDVDKVKALLDMHERVLDRNAEAAFNSAFASMLPNIPTIRERAKADKTKYAPLEDIVEELRPILGEFGFAVSFRTEWPNEKLVKVIGILTHTAGHQRQSEFMSAADNSGSKNAIQALGSAVAYGKRYTFKDLLCIVTRDEDDDGNRAGQKAPAAKEPDGYQDWLDDMTALADNGTAELQKQWNTSKPSYRDYLTKNAPQTWAALKTKAAKVSK